MNYWYQGSYQSTSICALATMHRGCAKYGQRPVAQKSETAMRVHNVNPKQKNLLDHGQRSGLNKKKKNGHMCFEKFDFQEKGLLPERNSKLGSRLVYTVSNCLRKVDILKKGAHR